MANEAVYKLRGKYSEERERSAFKKLGKRQARIWLSEETFSKRGENEGNGGMRSLQIKASGRRGKERRTEEDAYVPTPQD